MKVKQYTNILGDHESVFFVFGVSGIVHFLLFEVPWELCLPGGWYCNNFLLPIHLKGLETFTWKGSTDISRLFVIRPHYLSNYREKKSLEKMILVLEKSLISPPQILHEPRFSV